MATNNGERIARLNVYVEKLQYRLSAPVPPRHKDSAKEFKAMLETDLKKTLMTIDSLKAKG